MSEDRAGGVPRLRLREAGLHWREVEGEVIALDVASATYFATAGSGAVLWRALVDGARPEELASALAAEFDVDLGTARADVDRFLADLRARGLVEDEDHAPAR